VVTIMTNRRIAVTIAVILFTIGSSHAALEAGQEQQPKKESKSAGDSMTGCVDEQNGRYVLTNDSDLALIAILEADGFPTEAFAKHLGHKVTVRGTVIPGGPQPTFKVRSVAAVSDTCSPSQKK
jgi:hypothetical protein